MKGEKDLKMICCWLSRQRKGLQAKECRCPLEARKDSLLELPEETQTVDTLILGL